ncbi:hypothetical protein ACLB2K_055816 [Fragaria x ananassa]
MANPSGNHQEPSHASSSFNPTNGNSTPVSAPPESSGAMKHNPGISMDWTAEEQVILDDGLANGIKQERVVDTSAKPSHFTTRPNVAPYVPPIISMDNDDGISYKAIGGVTGELLEQNAQALNQISANLQAFQIQENINLFCQARDNILKIMNDLNDMPDVMKQMPPLPVKVNEELVNHVLPPPAHPKQ